MDFYIARHSQIASKRKKMGQKESARAVPFKNTRGE
jgi:hypothetical protein